MFAISKVGVNFTKGVSHHTTRRRTFGASIKRTNTPRWTINKVLHVCYMVVF